MNWSSPVGDRHAIRALGVAVCLLASAAASGQELPAEPGGRMVEVRPAQVQQLFDAMLVMQAQDALSLSESQYAQFLTRLRVLQDTRRRNQQERNRLIGELQRLTNPRNPRGADEDIKQRLTALADLEARGAVEVRRAYDALDEVLDVRQQARFRVLEEQIERRKLELVSRARQGNPNRPPPARKQPPR